MVDTIFLEDGDLLENINIMESIFTPSYENLINEAITENEMMISIYQTQQFLIEQDTQIFMKLRYSSQECGAVQEGVIENIGKAIMNILRKIKKLIMKFIGFITGNRKKESESGNKNVDYESDNKEIDKIKNVTKQCEKELDDLEKYYNDRDKISNKINELLNKVRDINADIKSIIYEKKYKFIGFLEDPKNLLLIDNDITSSDEVNNLFEAAFEAIYVLKDESKLKDMHYRSNPYIYCKVNKLNKIVKILDDAGRVPYADVRENVKYNIADKYKTTSDERVDRSEYLRSYKVHKHIFERYSGNTDKYLKNLKDGLKNKIDPLSKEIDNLKSDYNYSDKDRYNLNRTHPASILFNILSDIVTELSSMYSSRIKFLTLMENLYARYKYNAKLLMIDGKKLKELSQESDKIFKEIDALSNERLNLKPPMYY